MFGVEKEGEKNMVEWNDLSEREKKRLQLPRAKLSKQERALRKKLFYAGGWFDAGGNLQQFQPPKDDSARDLKKIKSKAKKMRLD